MRGGFEPSHLALALPRRLMRDLRSIVLVLPGAVNDRRHGRPVSGRVAAQFVRDQSARLTALPLQQRPEEALGCMPIAPGLDEDVDHVAVLVNGTPEILPLALDVHEEFVQVPGVAQASLPSPERPGVRRTECPTPLPNGLVGHGDAPLCQEIFGVSETQTKAVVKPDGVADDQRGKAVSVVAGALLFIGLLCQPPSQLDNTVLLEYQAASVRFWQGGSVTRPPSSVGPTLSL